MRDGEFTWQDKASNSKNPSRTVSKDSVHSGTSSDISDSVFNSPTGDTDGPLLEQDYHSCRSKTLELGEINLHITKVYLLYKYSNIRLGEINLHMTRV